MTTAVIIIAAGEATRWAGHLGIDAKHLIEIDGERLIDRTVRLFRQHTTGPVYVVSKLGDDRYRSPGALRVDAHLNPDNGDADKFLSSRHLWSTTGRTIVVYGDCWFSEDAVARIMGEQRREWLLFCRFGPSEITGATSGECWAVQAWPEHHGIWEAALHRVAGLWRERRLKRCGGWETYRAVCGVPDHELRRHRNLGHAVEVSDMTEDFDHPKDYDRWIERHRAGAAPPRRPAAATVSVLVPWRSGGDPDREAAWQHVQQWWAQQHPGWQVVTGDCGNGPWRKATAVADALTRADHDLLVIADADVVCDGIQGAAEAVTGGEPWAIPHRYVRRLTRDASQAVYGGAPLSAALGGLARPAYEGVEGGGLVVLRRETYERAPLDPRFATWGQDDDSWALALRVLAGPPWRGLEDLWHFWHPPADRLNQHVGNKDGWALHIRYQTAAKAGSDPMRRLIGEFQPAPVEV